jgi:diacylglycerol kinase family enzyme
MTSGVAGRATPRWLAAAALGGLALLAAGLVQVIVGSRGQFLYLLAGTVLSVAVVAAAAWWAFTTRRVWKRWLNIAIAVLTVANTVLGYVVVGVRQATGALAIVAGALIYASAAPRALRAAGRGGLWTTGTAPSPGPGGLWTTGTAPSPARLPSRAGAPQSGGSAAGVPWLVVNPRSGDGKAGRVGLVGAARARGVRVHVLEAGEDLVGLARAAVAEGASALGVAGGDGSLGLVAKVAVEADVPFVCVPSGTRNHFAGDMGLDRADPLAALAAFAGPERRVDVAMVGDRMFVNNVSLGAYADLVADPRYRAGKLATAHAVLPASLRGERELLRVALRDAEGREHPDVLVLLVACNPYALKGVRERMDVGLLQVSALRARTGAALAGVATRVLTGGGRAAAGTGWAQWTTSALRVEAPLPRLPAGIDGEAATIATPLEFRILPGALRVLVPPAVAARGPRVRFHRWATVRDLLRLVRARR